MIWFGHVERIDNELVQSREVSDGTLSTDFVQYLELKYHEKRRLLTVFTTDAP